jgi:Arc/MetJ family transcription regulator
MATNLALDDKLLNEALEVGNLKTKKDTVTVALKEFIDRRKQLKIIDLAGTFEFDPKYDYKKLRHR